VKDYYNQL
jgi:serine/threonine protein kinase